MDMIAFIGGGNMASAIIGGLVKSGRAADSIVVIDPGAAQRDKLHAEFGVRALAAADAALAQASMLVWAVKPQLFNEAAAPCAAFVAKALHLSVMAGIRSDALVRATGAERIVRTMPNTPALVGQGMTGLFARDAVSAADRAAVEAVLAPTGRLMWVAREDDLDAVTALSGSGPAYVFYFVEAMMEAAAQMGLSAEQGKTLRARHLRRRDLARAGLDRCAGGAARARHVQGRHDLRRAHCARSQRRQGGVHHRVEGCATARARTRRRIRALRTRRDAARCRLHVTSCKPRMRRNPVFRCRPIYSLATCRPRATSACAVACHASFETHKETTMSYLSYVSQKGDTAWDTYISQVDRVLPYLGNLARWSETLKRPKRILIVDVPIELDNGSVAHFEGYRVQHNLSRGPGKGGVRFHPDVTLEEVMALSAWMTIKNAPR